MSKTDWFRDAKWGVFCHYLTHQPRDVEPMSADQWNAQVDSFDVPSLVNSVASTGARYFFLTIGQVSGHWCSPNQTYDSIVGQPSKCSKRDLIMELADEFTKQGIRMMVYLPSHAPSYDINAIEKLKCTPPWDCSKWYILPGSYTPAADIDKRLTQFQLHWQAIIAEWSKRWAHKVHGWWFDGCYYADTMYRHDDEPNFKSFAAAAKAGNPNSIVAFNPGVLTPVICYTQHEDYTAGEIAGTLPTTQERWNPPIIDGKVENAQYHILTYMGDCWGAAPLRFTNAFAVEYTKIINNTQGVVTWDVPISKTGQIPQEFLQQLTAIGNAV